MTNTTNYNLKKPAQTDFYNVDDFNDNADIIDTQLKNLNDNKADNDDLSDYQTKNDNTLNTTDKTIVGAINEINAKPSSSLTLGETSTTAYRGDRGAVAYTHSQSAHAPTNAQKNSLITKAEIEAKLTGAITSHTHNFSTLALGETSTTAYRGDRGAVAYTHSQSTHAPTNAQKNSLITKAEIEAKLTGVITSHSHSATFNGGWELIEDSGVISYANLPTGKNFSTTTLSKEYTQIKLELRCVGLGQPFGEDSKLWLDSTALHTYKTYADISTFNRVIILNRCDELSNRDSTRKSFNSGMYNATSGINTLNFGSAVTHKFKGSNTFNKGTAQLLIYGRL